MSGPTPSTGAHHDERLWPGPAGWAFVLGFAVVVTVALVPVDVVVAGVVGAVVGVVGVFAAVRTSPPVRVADGVLTAGRASIPVDLLGRATALDRAGVRRALGPGSDARTYACLRSWIPGGVLVEVVDPQDPTPAWLISTRDPEGLLEALTAQRSARPASARPASARPDPDPAP